MATALAGVLTVAMAPGALASTTVNAYGIEVTLANFAKLGPEPLANLSNPNASLASAKVGPVSAGALTASVTQNTTTAPGTESATASTADLTAALGVTSLSSGTITATCDATQGKTPTGTVSLENLKITGMSIPVSPAPNTTLSLPDGLGSITLNKQTTSGGQLTVQAISISLLSGIAGGGTVIISSATCGPASSVRSVPLASAAGITAGGALAAVIGMTTVATFRRRKRAAEVS